MTLNVATGMNYGVASSLSWSKSICCPEMGIMRIRGPLKTTVDFKDEHPERACTSPLTFIAPEVKPLGSHMVGWTTVLGCTGNQVLQFTHPSTIPA